jgi:hypothetical protein
MELIDNSTRLLGSMNNATLRQLQNELQELTT